MFASPTTAPVSLGEADGLHGSFENMYPFQFAMGHQFPRDPTAGREREQREVEGGEEEGEEEGEEDGGGGDAGAPRAVGAVGAVGVDGNKEEDVQIIDEGGQYAAAAATNAELARSVELAHAEIERLRAQVRSMREEGDATSAAASQVQRQQQQQQQQQGQNYVSRPIQPRVHGPGSKSSAKHPESGGASAWRTFVRMNLEFAKLVTLVLVILTALALHSVFETALDPYVTMKAMIMRPWGVFGLRMLYPVLAVLGVWLMKLIVTFGTYASRT